MAGSALTLVGCASGMRRLTDWFDHDISQLPKSAVGVFAGGVGTLDCRSMASAAKQGFELRSSRLQ